MSDIVLVRRDDLEALLAHAAEAERRLQRLGAQLDAACDALLASSVLVRTYEVALRNIAPDYPGFAQEVPA